MALHFENQIGVMQGRLLPKYKGRYQAHPLGYWKDEFIVAKEIGLDCIEFILDFNDADQNPLMTKKGIFEILKISKKTGVMVKTICADYFMDAPLHSSNKLISNKSLDILNLLIQNAGLLNVNDIVIPCVDNSSLSSKKSIDRFIHILKTVIPVIESNNVNLSLETDLPPSEFSSLLKKINSKMVTVNYDIGNSAALGFDPLEELNAYGEKISDIHIKDRNLGSGSVILGEGCADFDKFFTKLREINYTGPFIMQAYRDDEGVEIFKEQFLWIQDKIKETYEN
jgi:L-ribulose-5-phosphate 3-epimerase